MPTASKKTAKKKTSKKTAPRKAAPKKTTKKTTGRVMARRRPEPTVAEAMSASAAAPGESFMVDSMSVRAVALSTGDLGAAVLQEVARIMGEQRNSQVRALQVGIDRLQQDGHVTAREARDLKTIARLVLGSTRERANVPQAADQVRELYQRMLVTGRGSPVALAIASAAKATLAMPMPALVPAMPGGTGLIAAATVTPGATGVGAVVGGVIGGVIGGIVGGGLGAGLGAAIGAAAGGAIGFCNEAGI